MNEKELNKTLRENAINCGLCAQWQKEWETDWDMEHMFSQFFRGLDFFLKYRFMTNQFMKDNFSEDARRSHNVLVDDDYTLTNPRQALIVGESKATIDVDEWTVSTIYALDTSCVNVTANDSSFVMIHIFDKAQVNVEKMGFAKVFVYLHSKDAVVISDDNIKIKEDFDYLK